MPLKAETVAGRHGFYFNFLIPDPADAKTLTDRQVRDDTQNKIFCVSLFTNKYHFNLVKAADPKTPNPAAKTRTQIGQPGNDCI